jgi:tetratricopeptide (TPR) repeat protein
VTPEALDAEARQELRSLPKGLADDVARNLVMTGRLLDEEPGRAYEYAKVALRLAARVAVVREAAGIAAYAAGQYAEALSELRAARRMTGSAEHWAVMADCERGLGRPERALQMAGAPEVKELDRAQRAELRIVAAGARRDLGQVDAALVTLQVPDLNGGRKPWVARLRYAYAETLLEAGREDEAREWFAKAVDADAAGETDAADRLAELDGLEFVDTYDPDLDDEEAEDAGGEEGGAVQGPEEGFEESGEEPEKNEDEAEGRDGGDAD